MRYIAVNSILQSPSFCGLSLGPRIFFMKKKQIIEQFLSIQGEGRSLGRLAYFIRFAGCNLRCGWCDSLFAVEPSLFQGKADEVRYHEVPPYCDLVVMTGGEPTLFDLKGVRDRLLTPTRIFEVESNATRFPEAIVDDFVWNLSPKLSSSKQKTEIHDRTRLQSLAQWATYAQGRSNVMFKFVMTGPSDFAEILELVKTFRISRDQVYLMAEGQSSSTQKIENVAWIIDLCKKEGFQYSPRLHVILWGDQRGV